MSYLSYMDLYYTYASYSEYEQGAFLSPKIVEWG